MSAHPRSRRDSRARWPGKPCSSALSVKTRVHGRCKTLGRPHVSARAQPSIASGPKRAACSARSERRRHQNDRVAPDEDHLDAPPHLPHAWLLAVGGLFLDVCDLLNLAEHHVEVLVIRVQPPSQLAIATALHKDALIQRETDEVQRLLDGRLALHSLSPCHGSAATDRRQRG